MSEPHEIETQFVLEVAQSHRPLIERNPTQMPWALSQALAVAFGLPYPTMVHLRITYTDRTQLLETNGVTHREPEPLEVQGLLIGALIGGHAALDPRGEAVSLRGDRVSDA